MDTLSFLTPINKQPTTKTFIFKNNRWHEGENFFEGKLFRGYKRKIKDLQEMFVILKRLENEPYLLVPGKFKDEVDLNNPIRKAKKENILDNSKPTLEDRYMNCVWIDIDGYEDNETNRPSVRIEKFIKNELPYDFQTADYIYQLSSSFGLVTDKLKCHLFFWLENSVSNLQIQEWIKRYNKKKNWGKILDPSIYSAEHSFYIQKRICKGASDPLSNILGLKEKEGNLKFEFKITPDLHQSVLDKYGNKLKGKREKEALKYNVAEGIKKILLSESYHEELIRMAMALLNRKIPLKTVQEWLEGAMLAAREGLTDPQRLKDWQTRFKDIPRAVRSGADLVNNPSIEDALKWVEKEELLTVKAEFKEKAINLGPTDLQTFINNVEIKTGLGRAAIRSEIKLAKREHIQKKQEELKKEQRKQRKKQGIYEIEITLSNSERVREQVCKILAKSKNGNPVFKAATGLAKVGYGQPVTIRQVMKKHKLGVDYPKIPLIQYYRTHSLGARIENDVVFMNEKGKEIPCPHHILKIIEDDPGVYFNPLVGIIEHPFVDTNFNIVQSNGYNKETGLFSVLHHKLKIELMNPHKAYKYLAYEVFDEFPFENELDRCVAVAALLTCLQRPVIAGDGGFPGFGIISPVQSSGKTTLAQLISYSIYNRPVAATTFSEDETELGKHLIAILREGHSCVLFDNLREGGEIRSTELAKAMSSDTYSGRFLGKIETITVPSTVVWLFTGNSIYFSGDFATRIFPISLNTKMENPERRIFKRKNIGEWAFENRNRIISAALSIILEGKNKIEVKTGSRFTNWDTFVRKPLFFASKKDINEAVMVNKKNDSILRAKIRLLYAIRKKFGLGKNFTTRDLVEKAFQSFEEGTRTTLLGEALTDLLDLKAHNKRSVGRFLSTLKGVVLKNLVLETSPFASPQTQWRVEKAKDMEPPPVERSKIIQ